MNVQIAIGKLEKHQYATIQNENLGITFTPNEVTNLVKKVVNTFYYEKPESIEINLLSHFETMQVISNGKLITLIMVSDELVLIELPTHEYIALNLGGSNV